MTSSSRCYRGHELPRRFSPGLAEQQDIGFSQKSFHPDL
jgi:hypothetical protein